MTASPRGRPTRRLPVLVGGAVAVTLVIVSLVLVALRRDDATRSETSADARTDGGVATSGLPSHSAPPDDADTDTAPGGGPGSTTTTPSTRGPTIEAGGDLAFQPSPAGPPTTATGPLTTATGPPATATGPPTTATGLSASFELSFTAQGATVRLTWPVQDAPGFDHYVVLRRAAPSQPDELPVAELRDPASVTFSEDLAVGVAPGTPIVTYRVAVADALMTPLEISTTLTLRLGWP